MKCITYIPQTQYSINISEEIRDPIESNQLQEKFDVPSNSAIYSSMGTQEISLWQQGTGSTTQYYKKIVIFVPFG